MCVHECVCGCVYTCMYVCIWLEGPCVHTCVAVVHVHSGADALVPLSSCGRDTWVHMCERGGEVGQDFLETRT